MFIKKGNFIVVPRALFESDELFIPESYSRREAFLDLVQRACFEERKVLTKSGEITLSRGDVLASVRRLAERWQWSTGKVSRVLGEFERVKIIERKCDGLTCVISIVNYDLYQPAMNTNGYTDGYTDEDNNNEIKKEKKEEKKPPIGGKEKKFVKPTVDQIVEYCLEKGLNIDAEYFIDYYESKGWKVGKEPMKDWKATVRNWARRQGEQTNSLFSSISNPLTPSSAPPPSPQLSYEEARAKEIELIRMMYQRPKDKTEEEWEYHLTHFVIPAQLYDWENNWRAHHAK